MSYPGGKGSCFKQLLNLIPKHDVYIETHLGGGTLMKNKKPAGIASYGVDLDSSVFSTKKFSGVLRSTNFINDDAVKYLNYQDYINEGFEVFIYCDPPYVTSTRVAKKIYKYEMTDKQHKTLLKCIKKLKCNVMISGYMSQLYSSELAGWYRKEIVNTTRGGKRIEYVWMNYDPDKIELHDYRFYGKDFRDRERIKRKTKRWVNKFSKMCPNEKNIIFNALEKINKGG